MVDNPAEMYVEEVSPANELKGFTKSFVKRSKDKREENKDVKDMISAQKEGRLICGTRVTEKRVKSGKSTKIYLASTCDSLMRTKLEHYAAIAGIECVSVDLSSEELAQKLGKPFYVTVACEVNE